MEVKLKLSNSEHKDLLSYCNLNDLLISDVVKKSFIAGFNIERYGLLGVQQNTIETIKEVEVIKEVPIEVIKEVQIIKEVPIEVIKEIEIIKEVQLPPVETKVIEYVDREVIKEVPVEKIVEKIVNISDNNQEEIFSQKIKQLEDQIQFFSNKTKEIESIFQKEKTELLTRISELESKEPEKIEIIKEVIKEVPVKIEDPKMKLLEETLHSLRTEVMTKDKRIKDLENKILESQQNKVNLGATFLRGSNLDNTLYK
jgi:hypothetical protein